MNVEAAITELEARGFDYLEPSRALLMLNDAKDRFDDAWEWPWLQAVVSAPAPILVPDLKYVLTVKLGTASAGPGPEPPPTLLAASPFAAPSTPTVFDAITATGRELLGIDVRVLTQGDTDVMQTGAPDYWYVTDDSGDLATLRTWPVSDANVVVVYVRVSPQLTAPTDTPLIPARYHATWIDLAVISAYHDSDNYAGAQALQADVNVRLQQIIERYETRNRQHSELIGQRYFSEDD